MRNLDLYKEKERIIEFIRSYLSNAERDRLVVGLSGGVDSAVSTALAVEAIGAQNVTALIMPYETSNAESVADARDLAKQLGINYQIIDITAITKAYFETYAPEADHMRIGNWLARIRMCVLYDFSAKLKALVLGTSNRTELMIGYFTQFGDSACAFEPIGHLYKTEVWKLAKILNIPEKIINKTPTADLWPGQSDEQEIGISYPVLDEIVYELTELHLNISATENLSYPVELYQKVERMIQYSAFKRRLPPILES
ncbi:MAG TPA: NAD+ synthase [Candidatus Syntrophosphaera thermopropionivorans]|nr:NAD+ synthase [Candidatus Syntrophosphaera thermopropionivorans]